MVSPSLPIPLPDDAVVGGGGAGEPLAVIGAHPDPPPGWPADAMRVVYVPGPPPAYTAALEAYSAAVYGEVADNSDATVVRSRGARLFPPVSALSISAKHSPFHFAANRWGENHRQDLGSQQTFSALQT